MITWWNGLQLIQQIFAVVAIPATLILVIQTILLLLGVGSDHDVSTHAGGMHDVHMHDFNGHDAAPHDAGLAHDSGADTAYDVHPQESTAGYHDTGLRLFTLQGIVAFFALGGWVGIALVDFGLSAPLAAFLALVAGTLSLFLVAWLLRLMLGLQSSGNLDISNAIGLVGEVYLHIPGDQKGFGKVTLLLQERSIELDAMTDDADDIATGAQVQVVARRGDRLLVRKLK